MIAINIFLPILLLTGCSLAPLLVSLLGGRATVHSLLWNVGELDSLCLGLLVIWLPDSNQAVAGIDATWLDFIVVIIDVDQGDLICLFLDINLLLPDQVLYDLLISDGLRVERKFFEMTLWREFYLDTVWLHFSTLKFLNFENVLEKLQLIIINFNTEKIYKLKSI